MGDVLWIEPVIRQLAAKYKRVIVHTRSNVLFENYPFKNVTFKDKQSLWEKIATKLALIFKGFQGFVNLDMSYEHYPREHFLHVYQKFAHIPETEEYPRLYLSEKERKCPMVDSTNYVVLHLESFSDKNYRKVYGIDWETVLQYLEEKGLDIFLIGKNPVEIKGGKYVKTDIREMISLIAQSKMFIGIDSGPSHIAASLGIPSLVFFGAVNPLYRHFPKIFKGYFLQQPCEYAGCFHRTAKKEDPTCLLVGDDGIPKCSLHSNEYIIKHIDLLTQ